MQRYPCPRCKERLEISRTANGKCLVSCPGCGAGDLLEYSGSMEMVILDFACRCDEGAAGRRDGDGARLEQDGMLRSRDEIDGMIGGNEIDETTRRILYTRKDYVSYYTRIARTAPEMGQKVSDAGLDGRIARHLNEVGILRFYRFQEEAMRLILGGSSVVIEAPTASGKTEAFLVPILEGIIRYGGPPGGVLALLVYPTKSLARDQLPKIESLAGKAGVSVGVFDGDVGRAGRDRILESPPRIIITNFDVLHYHMWHRTRFAALLAGVKFLVADETHVYSGIFGTNIHYIIKRLCRLAGNVQFVAASATLDDAGQFCGRLFGRKMEHVRGTGGGGDTDLAMLSPSLRTQRELMVELASSLVAGGHKTMVFSNSHRNAELLAIHARRRGVEIMVHRGGLTAEHRRRVEKSFKASHAGAISCTPTLELGIDVGDVDCVISSTIPVNRLMQRIGRAARGGQRGYAFLALGGDPISQYYRGHPRDYLEDTERTYIDPGNPFVEGCQVLAMACDMPIPEGQYTEHAGAIKRHVADGSLVLRGGRYEPDHAKAAAILGQYSIRGIGERLDILLGGRKVGERSLPIALEELHQDAVYFLGGSTYIVKKLAYPAGLYAVLAAPPPGQPYYTRALTEEWPTIEKIYEKRDVFGMETAFCRIHIKKSVYGYARLEIGAEAGPGARVPFDVPLEYDYTTKGMAFCAPRPASEIDRYENGGLVEAGGYHAAEHVVIEGCNMIAGGVSRDLGGISMGSSGMIFVYDGAIGGSGASRALYDRLEGAVGRGAAILGECPCEGESGCPRCTFSYRCGNNNECLHKLAALEVFERIRGGQKTSITKYDSERPLV